MPAENSIYQQSILDFVAASTEFCRAMEQCAETEREEWMNLMWRLLPLVYLRAQLLPAQLDHAEGFIEHCVTEADYDFVRNAVASKLGSLDDFLDVFVEDFKYSDQPVLRTVSENLADTYQILREMVETFRQGHEEAMLVALEETMDDFASGWGQALLGALRAIHDIQANQMFSETSQGYGE